MRTGASKEASAKTRRGGGSAGGPSIAEGGSPFAAPGEAARVAALHACGILDTPPEGGFDEIAELAARICNTPIALVSLVDSDRQWFKARIGFPLQETPREIAFCAHAILAPDRLLVVEDALADPRFANNPLVMGDLGIRFYAGAPILGPHGDPLGTLCVLDRQPRLLDDDQRTALSVLSRQVAAQIELRSSLRDLNDALHERQRMLTEISLGWELAVAVNEASTVASAIEAFLTKVCTRTGWDIGQVWFADRSGDVLRCGQPTYLASEALRPFRAASLGSPLSEDTVLSGRAFRTGVPVWIEDVSTDPAFPRTGPARSVGLVSAVAIPVISAGTAVAALEFFSRERRGRDDELIGVLTAAAAQLGTSLERKRAEDARRESEQRFQRVFQESPVGVGLVGLDHRILRANGALCRMLGYSEGELQQLTSVDITHPGDRGLDETLWTKLLHQEMPVYHRETRYLTKQGNVVWVTVTVSIVKDPEGKPTYGIGIVENITARKQADRRLAAQHAATRVLAEAETEQEAVTRLIEVVCRALDLEFGAVWTVDEAASALRCVGTWRAAHRNESAFEDVTRTRTFERGIGLPGRVWASGEPAWIEDVTVDPNFPRAPYAALDGLHAAFGFPIKVSVRTIGVIEFFSSHIEPLEPELLQMMASLGSQLGQFTERTRAEAALRDYVTEVEDLYENAPCGYHSVGPNGTIARMNATELAWLGYSKEEVVGRIKISDILTPRSLEEFDQTFPRFKEGDEVHDIELGLVRKDGTILPALLRATAIRDADGNFVISRSTLFDITEFKRSEAEVTFQRALMEAVTETSIDGVLVVDTAGRVLLVNERFRELWRLPGSTAGADDASLLGSAMELIVDPEAFLSRVRQLYGDPYARSRDEIELKDGRTLDRYSAPVRSPNGTYLGRVWFFRDITKRKRYEAAIQESEARFRKVFEEGPTGMAIIGPDVGFQRANAALCILLGYSEEELKRLALGDLAHPEDAGVAAEQAKRVFDGKSPRYLGEHRLLTRQNGIVWVSLAISVVRDSEGTALYGLAVIGDITPLKHAEDTLRVQRDRLGKLTKELGAANKEMEAFSYSVSHDLRAPLRGINTLSQVLLDDHAASLDEEGAAHIHRLRSEARRMSQLIEDLLRLSRATQTEIQRVPTDLSALAEEVVAELRRSDPTRQIETTIKPGVVAEGDAQLCKIVLENLIGNAWKYTSNVAHPHIEVGSRRLAGVDAVFVRDNGAGFESARAGELFHPFKRLHGTEFAGTGIGLATVQRIVARHGGRAWAESPGPGKGAMFSFTLDSEPPGSTADGAPTRIPPTTARQ